MYSEIWVQRFENKTQPTSTCHPGQPLFSHSMYFLLTFYRHAFWRRIIITDWETEPVRWILTDHKEWILSKIFVWNSLFLEIPLISCIVWIHINKQMPIHWKLFKWAKRWYLIQQPFRLCQELQEPRYVLPSVLSRALNSTSFSLTSQVCLMSF